MQLRDNEARNREGNDKFSAWIVIRITGRAENKI